VGQGLSSALPGGDSGRISNDVIDLAPCQSHSTVYHRGEKTPVTNQVEMREYQWKHLTDLFKQHNLIPKNKNNHAYKHAKNISQFAFYNSCLFYETWG